MSVSLLPVDAKLLLESMRPATFNSIRPGARVKFLVPAGRGRDGQEWKPASGRAVICGPDHIAVNMGGRHGKPGVVDTDNYISHTNPKSQ